MILDPPGFSRDSTGKPLIRLDAESLYAYGHLIRGTEELLLDLFARGLLSGTTHTCLGQELCQMAVVRALNDPSDVVLSNHRNHGHFLTYSGDFVGLVAEVMGRADGVCHGYGGSQHIAFRNFHSNGVQAGMAAIGTGLSLERKSRGQRSVVAVMVGDGTMGEGLLYESMNLASIWKVPTLFVVENNGIAQTTYTHDTIGGSLEGRGAAFGLDVWRLDDSAEDFFARVATVVEQVRASGTPGFLIIDTGRLGPHSKGDDLRASAEVDALRARDPLSALGKRISPSQRDAIHARNEPFLKSVEAAATASPEASFGVPRRNSFRTATESHLVEQPPTAPSVRAALNAALRKLLADDRRVTLLGEDLHDPYGGAFKVTAGLSRTFPERVISTPICEGAIIGSAIGLALGGQRPIAEIMFADFLTLGMDQIYNHAVKFPAMFEDCQVPLVVRTPCGGRRGYGPTHSQSPENLFVSVPGLTVIYGSHRHNLGQLLVNAVQRWPNPTLFLENKLLYGEAQDPAAYQVVTAHAEDPGADLFPTLVQGSTDPDITLLTFGGMLPFVERAAQRLRDEEELEVEVVVLAQLAPLPRNTLLPLLIGRSRIAVVEESHHEFGVSAEILAALAEASYRGKVIRIGTPPLPIASARSLERSQLPSEDSITRAVLSLL